METYKGMKYTVDRWGIVTVENEKISIYEVIFQINKKGYNSFLTVQIEDVVEDERDAFNKALVYAEDAIGPYTLELVTVDELITA